MDRKYCKFNNEIYEIDKITKPNIYLKKNNLIVKTNIQNIEFLPRDFKPRKRIVPTTINIENKICSNEIMLRHMTKEDAISTLDKYIDDAILGHIGRVRIIHGRHGGVLRKAVHDYLSKHPHVKEYHLASYGDGDIGVTIAILGKKS